MFVIKVGIFFLKVVMGNKLDTIFLHVTPISGSYSSDFAYQLYPRLIVKKTVFPLLRVPVKMPDTS